MPVERQCSAYVSDRFCDVWRDLALGRQAQRILALRHVQTAHGIVRAKAAVLGNVAPGQPLASVALK